MSKLNKILSRLGASQTQVNSQAAAAAQQQACTQTVTTTTSNGLIISNPSYQGTLSNMAGGALSNISLGGINIVSNPNVQSGHMWTSSVPINIKPYLPDLSNYDDNEIMEEYIKRFTPLAKAMTEDE